MNSKTIIAIDDDNVTLKIIEKSITSAGFTAHCYNNPVQGIDAIRSIQPDAILLDRIMPMMDGNVVISLLQDDERTRNIPIIMLTSKNDLTDITASLGLGARDYIVKPFDNDNLIIRLKKLMGMF